MAFISEENEEFVVRNGRDFNIVEIYKTESEARDLVDCFHKKFKPMAKYRGETALKRFHDWQEKNHCPHCGKNIKEPK